jgi:penicillin-binding protein 2
LGLGQKFNIGIPGEKSGLIPTRTWKKESKGNSWQRGETLLAGIGQGFILTTPLQLVVMISRLVNGGNLVTPSLTREIVKFANKPKEKINRRLFKNAGFHPSHLRLINQAMIAVTNSPVGTAYKARILEPGFTMGGKTGTVQVRRITEAERETRVLKNKELAWHERDHAVFVGYAPIKTPRYAVSVVMEHGGSGAKTAAPIARDILLELQKLDPTNESGIRLEGEEAHVLPGDQST